MKKIVHGMMEGLLWWLVSRLLRKRRSKIYAGKVFAMTGDPKGITRSVLERVVANHGGRISLCINSRTDYIIVGAFPGSKLTKAREYGVQVLNEGAGYVA